MGVKTGRQMGTGIGFFNFNSDNLTDRRSNNNKPLRPFMVNNLYKVFICLSIYNLTEIFIKKVTRLYYNKKIFCQEIKKLRKKTFTIRSFKSGNF